MVLLNGSSYAPRSTVYLATDKGQTYETSREKKMDRKRRKRPCMYVWSHILQEK